MPGTKPFSPFTRWLLTLAVCLVVTALLAFFKVSEIQGVLAAVAAQPEYSETVETAAPRVADFQPRIETLGEVVAPLQLTLRNELAGYITEVKAVSGSKVEKGQLIVQLDISEQRANLASARARLTLAKSVLQRDQNLQKSSFVSADKVDRSLAEVAVVEAEIDGIESVINRRTIRAPFAGVLGIHRLEVGQYLDNNSELTTLRGDNGEMWVDFNLPQFYGELMPGSAVQVQVVRAELLGEQAPLTAQITAGEAGIDAAARSRKYRAVVTTGATQLLDNMSVTVSVAIGAGKALMAIPSVALRSDSAGEFVWLLDRDSSGAGYRARRQAVTRYGQQGEQSFVNGLQQNDLMAAAGAFKLSPDLLVKTASSSGAQ